MPYPKSEVIKYGAAPNPSANATLAAAEAMATHWETVEKVLGIFINTTVPVGSGGVNAQMVPLAEVDPLINETDPPLFYQVQITGIHPESAMTNYFAVCQWGPICKSIGVQAATEQYLDLIDPLWRNYPETVAIVAALPTLTTPAPIVTPPPGPSTPPPSYDTGLASPDWLVWAGNGWLAPRAGDISPSDGSVIYEDDLHGKWVKKNAGATPFGASNIHWEMVQ